MQSAVKIIVAVFLLTSVVVTGYRSAPKLRRDGVLNLYPFPRVGRASRNTWQVPVNDLYLDYEPAEKRQLYAFPRVGRSDVTSLLREQYGEPAPMPARRADNPGMWFGPRLGRSFKSEEDDITVQNENVGRSEPELMEPMQEERKKRQIKQN